MKPQGAPGVIGLLLGVLIGVACQGQGRTGPAEPRFYFGADLSYVNEMEDCGAVYREDGEPKDPFVLFRAHGANLARARLWHDPDWTKYSTLEDVKRTFRRAQEAGMETVLDFHYSDTWADPGRQEIPAAWASLQDEDELAAALYQYTYDVLLELHHDGLMPDFVQIGNETNAGLLKERVVLDWPRDAKLFQAGIRAVRNAAQATRTSPRIILHVAQPENAGWWFREAAEYGIHDFDIIGVSYYPQWSSLSISGMASQANDLHRTFGKEVMVVETGYSWTLDSVSETAGNVLTQGEAGYPMSPAGQLQFMRDLTQALIHNGALGVVYWEPAWVSTACSTRWGQGSHWENATFFDFENNNELLPGIAYMSASYSFPNEVVDGVLQQAYGHPLVEDAAGDALQDLPELDLRSLHVLEDSEFLSFALTVAGDVLESPGTRYRFYFDVTEDDEGATADIGKRPILIDDPFRPEFALEVQIAGDRSTAAPDATFNVWSGIAWESSAFTGGMAIEGEAPSVIEVHIAKKLLGQPAFLNVAVLSAGRVLTHTAADVLGSSAVPADTTDEVSISSFERIELASN